MTSPFCQTNKNASPRGSMGLVYVPTFTIKQSTIHVGKYAIHEGLVWIPATYATSELFDDVGNGDPTWTNTFPNMYQC